MRRLGGLATYLLLLLAALPAAEAAAEWSEPRPVAPGAAQTSPLPPFAVNQSGQAVVAWNDPRRGVRVATRRAGASSFARPVTVPGSRDSGQAVVAINDRGDVVVGWPTYVRDCACQAVSASTRRAGSSFRQAQIVSLAGENAGQPVVAIGPGGTAGVSWQSEAGVEASFARRGGAFGRPAQISRYELGYQHALVFDGRDRATAFWRIGSRKLERLRHARRDPSGALSAPRTAAAPVGESTGFEFWDFLAATDSAGRHLLAWTRYSDFGPNRIEVASANRSGHFGPRHTLARAGGEPGESVLSHHLGVAPNGAAAVAWTRSTTGTSQVEVALRRSAGAGFSVRQVPASGGGRDPRVAIAGSGRSALAWTSGGSGVATVGDGGGNLADPFTLPGPGSNPGVGIDRHGNALVVWSSSDGLVFSDFRRGS